MHIRFKPGGRKQPTIDTDCSSITGRHRVMSEMSETFTPSVQPRPDSGSFFSETAKQLSAAFRNDTTSETVKTYLGRHNKAFYLAGSKTMKQSN